MLAHVHGSSIDFPPSPTHTVSVVELEDQVLIVSEGNITYTTCVVKSSVTAVPVTVEIVDAAGSAVSNRGN